MAKFIIECPHCGTYREASTGFFARKILECTCGKLIDVNRDRYTIKTCPHCGNNVMFDQAKGDNSICPVCKKHLVTEESKNSIAHINCPSCSCELSVDKNATYYDCPLCNTHVDVQEQIKKQEIKNKGLASVIKYEGGNDVLVWKHPIEDFNLGSQLIVHESQEAIFFRDGEALDLFGAGRYTLATQKLPLLENLYKLPTNEVEAFHSEVYFINLVTQTGIKWGTDSKVRMFDPASGLSIELGACGEFNLRVVNSRKLLIKLVGTTSEFKNTDVINMSPFSIKFLTGKFKALIVSKVKTILAKTIKDNNINILEVDAHIEEIAASLKVEINKTLEEYGLFIPEFYVSSILTPDDDPNFRRMKEQYAEQYLLVRDEQIKKNIALAEQQRRVVQAQTGAQEEIIAAQAKAEAYRLKAQAEAQEMQMKGYTYQQETQRQVGLGMVNNQGNGGSFGGTGNSMVNDIVGLGVTLGTVGTVVNMTKDVLNPAINASKDIGNNLSQTVSNGWNCPNCNEQNITGKFCPECGTKKPETNIGWTCPSCGKTNITSKFCPECGAKKPEANPSWNCPNCGEQNITGKFCPECGTKKGE